ncbi:hypothetical protein Ahy_A09g046324 isoform B [Arachis hypogaea]|uniref:ATP-dependent DNA helicase n=1 Tax=Arachis hypogaea TaxID=3818 RepID=A0A445BPI1_ARAHY|nr:hypothetical protein Ahy_A09g046324 isoform B [Arachis hypogaea]
MDNRNVVPYNAYLLMSYQAHVNVEYCNKSNNAIKYLFKYVNKGLDRVAVGVTKEASRREDAQVIDEIKQFYDCRYLPACEAVWRTLAYDIHQRWPSVIRLTFHLPREQNIIFKDDDDLEETVEEKEGKCTMFLAWMEANKKFESGQILTYAEFSNQFVYDRKAREWHPRKRGYSVGMLNYVPPSTSDIYYMRILLAVQRDCTTYEFIRTVKGITYSTFQDACYSMRLLCDDREFITAINELLLLISNSVRNLERVWNATWTLLADRILYERRKVLKNQDCLIIFIFINNINSFILKLLIKYFIKPSCAFARLNMTNDKLKNLCLIEIETILNSNVRSLRDYQLMPYPEMSDVHLFQNKLIEEELAYDTNELTHTNLYTEQKMTHEKMLVFDEILNAVITNSGSFYFIYGHGGCGKTFIWISLSFAIQFRGKIVLNVASSGISSLLLPGSRMAHFRFSIPVIITDGSTCNINHDSLKAELLIQSSLIIWDEAPMLNKMCFEILDQTLMDLMSITNQHKTHQPFGGKVVVLGGDFRQILPVIPKRSRHDILTSAINSSHLWSFCKVLKLHTNMRLLMFFFRSR